MASPVRLLTPAGPVSFKRRAIEPPSHYYITEDDRIQVEVLNSHPTTALELRARVLRVDGKISYIRQLHTPNTDRSRSVFLVELAEGFLLGVTVVVTADDVRRGQCWVTAGLVQGGVAGTGVMHPLVADYAISTNVIGWPGGNIRQSVEGPGYLRFVIGTTPAAGSNITETVPTNARWRLLSWAFGLTTAIAIADRQVLVLFDDGGAVSHYRNSAQVTQPALNSFIYQVGSLAYNTETGPSSVHIIATPDPPALPQGFRFQTSVFNLQAADTLVNSRFLVEEWIEE